MFKSKKNIALFLSLLIVFSMVFLVSDTSVTNAAAISVKEAGERAEKSGDDARDAGDKVWKDKTAANRAAAIKVAAQTRVAADLARKASECKVTDTSCHYDLSSPYADANGCVDCIKYPAVSKRCWLGDVYGLKYRCRLKLGTIGRVCRKEVFISKVKECPYGCKYDVYEGAKCKTEEEKRAEVKAECEASTCTSKSAVDVICRYGNVHGRKWKCTGAGCVKRELRSKVEDCPYGCDGGLCRKPACGVETYKLCRASACGVSYYKLCRTSACGVSLYKLCRTSACGTKTCLALLSCSRCGKTWYGLCKSCTYTCGYKLCRASACGVSLYKLCRTSACGTVYKLCRASACGVKLYKSC